MHEVVQRRYRRCRAAGHSRLIVIDGGKGQLSAAHDALASSAWPTSAVASPKGGAAHTREHADPSARAQRAGAAAVQRMRDEAHRFAVTFHRQARAMRDLRSELDEVPGVGRRRRKALLTKFGSALACGAPREELAAGSANRRCRSCVFRESAVT
jgi:excinuclease ABC subunit C